MLDWFVWPEFIDAAAFKVGGALAACLLSLWRLAEDGLERLPLVSLPATFFVFYC